MISRIIRRPMVAELLAAASAIVFVLAVMFVATHRHSAGVHAGTNAAWSLETPDAASPGLM